MKTEAGITLSHLLFAVIVIALVVGLAAIYLPVISALYNYDPDDYERIQPAAPRPKRK